MARWVRRMKQVPGWEEQFNRWMANLNTPPSVHRVKRLTLILHRKHVVIGRGMYSQLSKYDALNYGSAVRRAMLDNYGDDRP